MPFSPDAERPTAFTLHFLGGSAREWSEVERLLAGRLRLIALDLPGFGDAAGVDGFAVADMADVIVRDIVARKAQRWFLVGHSMGAKVATVIARRAQDGDASLAGLAGVVLVAGSPPSPEPMDETRRTDMLGWFAGDARSNRDQAHDYIAANAVSLSPAWNEQAVDDVLRMNRAAWTAWLERGSREDWATRIGTLKIPALIVAGARDGDLGPHAQRELMLPHFANGRLVTIAGTKHLVPMEAAVELASLIDDAASLSGDARYDELIASERVGAATRRALTERAEPDDPLYDPVCLDRRTYAVLRALAARIVPQSGNASIDLAQRIDRELADGTGDGWRFAALPPDAEAFARGLATLDRASQARHATDFASLTPPEQNDVLAGVAAGSCDAAAPADERFLSASAMRAWFEDARAAAVRAYVLHPTSLARLGYGGIANGGDGQPKTGFIRVGVGEREAWEPLPRTGDIP